jgi:DNA repair protein RecN (Recombination protein N)
MLTSLFIQNYALIKELNIRFEKGFSVITGETGAGKSIMLGAIGLLLGQRADIKSIRPGESRCIIEAHFDLSAYHLQPFFEESDLDYEDECIVRREISASGKTRAFINDTPVQLAQLKELGEQLIDIHSQHQNLLLNNEGFQLRVLDILAVCQPALDSYRRTYESWRKAEEELKELKAALAQSKSEEDYLSFQVKELEEAHLDDDEESDLEQECDMLTHAEDIKSALYEIDKRFSADETGTLNAVKEGASLMESVLPFYPALQSLSDRLSNSYIELKDIVEEIQQREDRVEVNSERLNVVTERLNLLHSLEQKHQVQNVSELIGRLSDYKEKLNNITSSDERIEELSAKTEALFADATKQADLLTERRTKAAADVEKQMAGRLMPLGMPNVRFEVKMGKRDSLGPQGHDTVTFLFSANKNTPLQNISQVASGGEIARVMLSVKAMIAGAVKLPTIIFDEIDTGVSGEIADKMASIMQEMSKDGRQVISITHLPQIASRGEIHYRVYKEDNEDVTNSHIIRLTDEQRVEEIAHMLSGAVLTEAAMNNARTLLEAGRAQNKKEDDK